MHKAWVEGDSAQADTAALPWSRRQLNRCSQTLGAQLTGQIQTFKYIIGVFATGVCSDQKRKNQYRDQEVFFLKEKQKEGGRKVMDFLQACWKVRLEQATHKLQSFEWARGTG